MAHGRRKGKKRLHPGNKPGCLLRCLVRSNGTAGSASILAHTPRSAALHAARRIDPAAGLHRLLDRLNARSIAVWAFRLDDTLSPLHFGLALAFLIGRDDRPERSVPGRARYGPACQKGSNHESSKDLRFAPPLGHAIPLGCSSPNGPEVRLRPARDAFFGGFSGQSP